MIQGTVFIRGLCVSCYIGEKTPERNAKQMLRIEIACMADHSIVAQSDDQHDCVNYSLIRKLVLEACKGKWIVMRDETGTEKKIRKPYRMLEALAKTIAVAIIKEFAVSEVSISIEKPNKYPDTDSVGITLDYVKGGSS